MHRHFALTANETNNQTGVSNQILESQVCGSGLTMQVEALVGDLISIGAPSEEIVDYILGFGLSWDEVKPVFASFGLAA